MNIINKIKSTFTRNHTSIIFIKTRAVLIIIFLTILIYLTLLYASIKYVDYKEFIFSIAELISVFVGITLGFYWNNSAETRANRIEYKRAFSQLVEELKENKSRLDLLYTPRYNNNILLLLKTTNWEICKDRFRNIVIDDQYKDIFKVRDIYHILYTINKHIEMYPFYEKVPVQDRNNILGLIDSVKGDIDNWITTISDFYGWKKTT